MHISGSHSPHPLPSSSRVRDLRVICLSDFFFKNALAMFITPPDVGYVESLVTKRLLWDPRSPMPFAAAAHLLNTIGSAMPSSGLLNAKFKFKGTFPTNHFRTYRWANKCPTNKSLTVFTQRNFLAEFLQSICNFKLYTAVFAFWSPFGAVMDNVRCLSWDH